MSLGDDPVAELRRLGLRPTRQRIQLHALLAVAGSAHLRPKEIFTRLNQRGLRVSLATVYNNLREFVEAGLIRTIVGNRGEMIFDTNVRPHHHILNEDTGVIFDTDQIDYLLGSYFPISPDQEISAVEITVKLRSKSRSFASRT